MPAARGRARGRARRRAVPASRPRRRGSSSAASPPAGSASSTRSSPRLGARAASASSSTWRRWSRPRRRRASSYEDVTTFPAVDEDIALVVADEVPAERVRDGGARRRAESCCARRGSSTSIAASRSERAARASPCGSSSAPPTAPSPTRRSPSGARRSRRRSARSEDRCVSDPRRVEASRARVLVAGASGFTGALAAELVWRHPRLELVAATSRSDAGARLDQLYPRYRVPLELKELDLAAARGRWRRRSSPTRTAPRRRWSPRCAGWGSRWSTYPPTSGSATCPPTSAGTARTATPTCSRAPSTGSPSSTASEIRDAELVANPGCYPTAALLALAPLAEAGLIAEVAISAESGVSGGGARRRRAASIRRRDRELLRLQRRGPSPRPEIAQELAALGSDGGGHLRRRTCCRSTRGCWRAATPTPTASWRATSCAPSTRERYARGAVRQGGRQPPGLRDVRDTNSAASTSRSTSAGASSPSPRSTTSGRAPPGRRSRT